MTILTKVITVSFCKWLFFQQTVKLIVLCPSFLLFDSKINDVTVISLNSGKQDCCFKFWVIFWLLLVRDLSLLIKILFSLSWFFLIYQLHLYFVCFLVPEIQTVLLGYIRFPTNVNDAYIRVSFVFTYL